jgi:hypothetical protein
MLAIRRHLPLELKDADDTTLVSPEVKALLDNLQEGFKSYRVKQDRRYDDLQKRLDAALLDAKAGSIRSRSVIRRSGM